jgi:hypothetical protein
MKNALCAGAVALAMIGLSFNARAEDFTTVSLEQPQQAPAINIGRIKSVLSLTPKQEAYWGPVEAALRNLYHRQTRTSDDAGFVRRMSHRAVAFVVTSAAIERLAVAARPLLAVLNEDQKRAASSLAQEMGFGEVMMAALK